MVSVMSCGASPWLRVSVVPVIKKRPSPWRTSDHVQLSIKNQANSSQLFPTAHNWWCTRLFVWTTNHWADVVFFSPTARFAKWKGERDGNGSLTMATTFCWPKLLFSIFSFCPPSSSRWSRAGPKDNSSKRKEREERERERWRDWIIGTFLDSSQVPLLQLQQQQLLCNWWGRTWPFRPERTGKTSINLLLLLLLLLPLLSTARPTTLTYRNRLRWPTSRDYYGNSTYSDGQNGWKWTDTDGRNLPDVLHLILRPIRIEDGVPSSASVRRFPFTMMRLGRLPVGWLPDAATSASRARTESEKKEKWEHVEMYSL